VTVAETIRVHDRLDMWGPVGLFGASLSWMYRRHVTGQVIDGRDAYEFYVLTAAYRTRFAGEGNPVK
jgi:hypothetical protein